MKLFACEASGVPIAGFSDLSTIFVTSHFVSPLVLACIRTVLFVYSFTTIIVSYAWLSNNTATVGLKDVNIGSYKVQQSEATIGQSFSFFTYFTFWSLGFYWLHDWPKFLQIMHSLYYSCITCMPFLVNIVFGGTMNSGWPFGRFEQWMNPSVHGLNSMFAVVEILLSATEAPPVLHLSVILLIMSVYLGLAYLTRYTQGLYVYEWLKPAHGIASIILHVLGYAAGRIAIFFLASGAIRLRNILARRLSEGKEVGSIQEKGMKLDDACDTWSSTVSVSRPESARRRDESIV